MAGGGPIVSNRAAGADDVPTEGKRTYAIIVCIFASLGGLFFGYDQGVTSAVLIMDSYLEDFCVGWHNYTYDDCTKSSSDLPGKWTTFTMWYNMIYNIGCIVGALLGGFMADKFGRRVAIFEAGVLFCIGTIWVVACPGGAHGSLLAARVVQGVGVGNSSFSLPLFGSEMAPKELRGMLSGFMQMTVTIGIMVANIINQCIKNTSHGWRVSNGVCIVAPVIVMCGIFFVPESPRWTYQHKGKEAAEAVLKKLRQTDSIGHELQAIGDQLEEEGTSSKYADLLEPSILKRVCIAMCLQVLQQATGINPVMSYGAMIFKDITGQGVLSALIISIVNCLSTIPAMWWVDIYGRRQLLLIGAVGMIFGHLLSAIVFVATCDGNTDNSGCPKGGGWVIVFGTCFFVFNFAISWGPICWIYPAEIFPLKVRSTAVSLSTMANWIMGVVMTYVVKLFPSLNIDGVFFMFAVTCVVSGSFVYFFCPETNGILLEDIEELFQPGRKKNAASPKYIEVETPNASLA